MSTYSLRVDELHLRFGALRLPAPEVVARLRSSIEREGLRTPVLASTGIESGQKVLVDGFKRLQAYPTAKRCIECQEKREREYAQEGRPTL